MKARKYTTYVPLARIGAPSFRHSPSSEEPIYVIQAVDDRFYPQQWDTHAALFLDVAGENIVNELPEGLDRKKDWAFGAYLREDEKTSKLTLVGLDAMPARPYNKSVVPFASKDVTELVIDWRPSGLAIVKKRPPTLSGGEQALIIRTINDEMMSGKSLKPGAAIKTARGRDLGKVVSVTDTEITVAPRGRTKSKTPVYRAEEE